MDEDEFMGHIADLQATHSSHVAGMMYGRTIMEPTNSTTHRRQRFRQSSQDWHQFLGFASAVRPGALGKRPQPWEDDAAESRTQRRY